MFKGIFMRLRPVTLFIMLLAIALGPISIALAEQANQETAPSGPLAPETDVAADISSPYYSVETVTLRDGSRLVRTTIKGPAKPPKGYELERTPVEAFALSSKSLPVPAYNWTFGCSATSASMIGAYFDRNGLPNIYTGPIDDGVMPMNNSIWPNWRDGAGSTYGQVPLAASHLGLDGRTTRGSIDDYWVAHGSSASDPYITGEWAPHAWGDAFGDYMFTSQSVYGNTDGATSFWGYSGATKLTCATMESSERDDGTLGRKHFYEARGYQVTDCYNQKTDNIATGGFSFAQYKAKIDAGYPVFLNLAGHSVVGIGYDDPSTVYINDTWDYAIHQMTWGGSYSGMALQSVSIADPALPTATPTPTTPPTETPTAGPTSTPTETLVPTETPTPTETPEPTNTPVPTNTPTPLPSNTGLKIPAANAAVTSGSGDNNGFQTTPAYAYTSNNKYAVDKDSGTTTSSNYTDAGKDRHLFYNYTFGLPANAAVLGIEVRLEAKVDSPIGTPKMYAQLSWDGGANWTAAKATATLSRSELVYTLGSASDTWGRTWTADELGNTNFRVRITNAATNISRDFSLDQITVRVTYR